MKHITIPNSVFFRQATPCHTACRSHVHPASPWEHGEMGQSEKDHGPQGPGIVGNQLHDMHYIYIYIHTYIYIYIYIYILYILYILYIYNMYNILIYLLYIYIRCTYIARKGRPPANTHTPHPTFSHHFITTTHHIHFSHTYHHKSSQPLITYIYHIHIIINHHNHPSQPPTSYIIIINHHNHASHHLSPYIIT